MLLVAIPRLVLDRILKGTHPLAMGFFFSEASIQGELVKLQEVGCLDSRRRHYCFL
jgi:hypothetical protein